MTIQDAAKIQVLLEGVPLPATKQKLIAYARRQDDDAARELGSLPEREYRSLDEVGEALSPVQPEWPRGEALPRAESGSPPGGEDYLDPAAEPGAVRPSAPAANPPKKALEQQTKTQKQQQQRQQQLG